MHVRVEDVEQEQIAAGLNRTGKKESRAMESTRIVGSKMDMKADVGIGEIMARMEVATMMKKYEEVTPDEIKGKVWWSTHNGEEPIGVKAKNAHVKSTTWAKPLKLPLEVTMYMKLHTSIPRWADLLILELKERTSD